MDANRNKRRTLQRRHLRVRRKIRGSSQRPRLAVYRSLNHLYAQLVDDEAGRTLLALSTRSSEFPKDKSGANVAGATEMGNIFAAKAKERKIASVVFDRGGRQYHGRVKAFAEAVRKGGIKF